MAFKTEKQAQAHCDVILGFLGDSWKGRVWDNLGWHVCWQWGSVTMYYSTYRKQYHCLIGEPDGCGGHIDLSQDIAGMSDDPKEAIRMACDTALEVIQQEWKPIEFSVSVVRLSL